MSLWSKLKKVWLLPEQQQRHLLEGNTSTKRMISHFISEFLSLHQKDMTSDPKAVLTIKKVCERAKRVLSFETQASIEIPSLFEVIIFYNIITRSRFEDLNGDLFMRCIELFQTCMSYAPMENDEIQKVILLSGSSQIPKVQQLLCERLRGKIFHQFIGTEAVAFGAAMKELSTRKTFHDVVPKFYEVNPYSVNLKTPSGISSVLIRRNSKIPSQMSVVFSTILENQPIMTIKLFEGETMIGENHHLGSFVITDIPPKPRGCFHIEVTFKINEDGILEDAIRIKLASK